MLKVHVYIVHWALHVHVCDTGHTCTMIHTGVYAPCTGSLCTVYPSNHVATCTCIRVWHWQFCLYVCAIQLIWFISLGPSQFSIVVPASTLTYMYNERVSAFSVDKRVQGFLQEFKPVNWLWSMKCDSQTVPSSGGEKLSTHLCSVRTFTLHCCDWKGEEACAPGALLGSGLPTCLQCIIVQ